MERNLKILVTGANGQLGHCIQDLAKESEYAMHQYFFTDVDDLNICSYTALDNFARSNQPDVIINAAAYTAVDNAEDDIEKAYLLNRDAVDNLARIAKAYNIYLVHISTDYVFSGEACHPYPPEAKVEPKSIYGKSKAAGEDKITASGCSASIIRTSWLYSEYGKNFVKTMLKLGRERDEVNVVSDQIGGPTYAGDLAKAIFASIKANINKTGVQLYHYADEGITSWYDFTQAIMEIGQLQCKVNAIFTSEYPAKAPRPAYSVFDLSKTKQELNVDIPYWRKSLSLTINKLQK